MRRVEAGLSLSFAAGRTGRGAKFPPQFGQTPPSRLFTQSRQNVHSNVHIIASVADGGRSLSQHSQLGRNSSMGHLASSCPVYRSLMLTTIASRDTPLNTLPRLLHARRRINAV
jgi:hypothetical protein